MNTKMMHGEAAGEGCTCGGAPLSPCHVCQQAAQERAARSAAALGRPSQDAARRVAALERKQARLAADAATLKAEKREVANALAAARDDAEWEAAEARVAEEMRQRAEARKDRLEAAAWFTYDRIRRDLLGRGAAWRVGCKGRPLCGKLVLPDGRRITPGQVQCRINTSLRHAGFASAAERASRSADIFTDVVKGLPRAA
jgi:hypothetical protein